MTGATTPSDAFALDQRLQRYTGRVASRDREVERVGPFTATFDPSSTNTYLNYAIPDTGAQPALADVTALVDAYERRDRVPRLEYLPGAAPAVEAVLLAGGFAVEARLPVMTCVAATVVALALAPGIAVEVPRSDEDFHALSLAQHAAFGDLAPEEPDRGAIARRRAAAAAGALHLLARDLTTGAVVGGGVATVPDDGVTEIAGIGVLESHRRQGVAGAITSALAGAAFAAGTAMAWLTPGDAGAHRVYARAGFADTSMMVHISRPPG